MADILALQKPLIAKAQLSQGQVLSKQKNNGKCQMGTLKGQIRIPDDFDSVLNDKIQQAFFK